MGKAVLISIHPEWCEKIVDGAKNIEVRKTRPKLEPPFKCYIYCTNSKDMLWVSRITERPFSDKITSIFTARACGGATKANGKVIGEFVCDWIDVFMLEAGPIAELSLGSLITPRELYKYAAPYMGLYGWHISDLVIYEEPKKLDDFTKPQNNCHRGADKDSCVGCWDCNITRPPQSWCYVEEDI